MRGPSCDSVWTLLSGKAESRDRVFSRPLGTIERAYYWDGAFDGVSDTVIHQVLEVVPGAVLSLRLESAREAWLAMKRRLPITSARIQTDATENALHFVVEEPRIDKIDGELEWVEGGAGTAAQVVHAAMSGPRQLSEQKLAAITIVHEHESRNIEIIYRIAHVITDGMGSSTLVRTFLNCMAMGQSQVQERDLAERLSMALSCDFLLSSPTQSLAKRRWHSALARIISQRSLMAMQEGQSFPTRVTHTSGVTPAKSREVLLKLPHTLSRAILRTCRMQNIGFGHVLPVINQIALSRFLQRRLVQGRISETDWYNQAHQPTHTLSPVNIRPMLNKDWLVAGGNHEMNIAFSVAFATLPYLPSPSSHSRLDSTGAPPFSSLLSRSRFFLRCKQTKRQMDAWVSHPLLPELREEQSHGFETSRRCDALNWRHRQNTDEHEPAVTPNEGGIALAYTSGSLGDVSGLYMSFRT